MANIHRSVKGRHASSNTVMHVLYGYYFIGMTRENLAYVYGKHVNTINRWINVYERDGEYTRKSRAQTGNFSPDHKEWILAFYAKHPVAFLDEAKASFERQFKRSISISTIWRILRDSGLTYKVLERRAMNIKVNDIVRFTLEINSIQWCHMNVQFLDEVSFDNR
ncbi:hypothetical protein LEN26_006544, partial [Aphanomyces euteiches]